jgi:hypothetical protein
VAAFGDPFGEYLHFAENLVPYFLAHAFLQMLKSDLITASRFNLTSSFRNGNLCFTGSFRVPLPKAT